MIRINNNRIELVRASMQEGRQTGRMCSVYMNWETSNERGWFHCRRTWTYETMRHISPISYVQQHIDDKVNCMALHHVKRNGEKLTSNHLFLSLSPFASSRFVSYNALHRIARWKHIAKLFLKRYHNVIFDDMCLRTAPHFQVIFSFIGCWCDNASFFFSSLLFTTLHFTLVLSLWMNECNANVYDSSHDLSKLLHLFIM